jgi:putative endonuclease
MDKYYYVYILTNQHNSVLYVGVTSNLVRRVYQHKEKLIEGFTKRYNVTKLIFYEVTTDVNSAIAREKQIKSWSRRKKVELIKKMNYGWAELYNDL